MKHEKISIKWKIFFYLLLFTACLLVLLWFFQIVYLDSFYKMITKNNARSVEQEAISILESDSEEKEEQLDQCHCSTPFSYNKIPVSYPDFPVLSIILFLRAYLKTRIKNREPFARFPEGSTYSAGEN